MRFHREPVSQVPVSMRLAIMQPYFLPYIGYFQLISAVDMFVVYDNIKYTKKGWINRNRMLQNGADAMFSLPLKHGSDSLDVVDRRVSPDFNRAKLLQQFEGSYRKAPYFDSTYAWLAQTLANTDERLFEFLLHTIAQTCDRLGITTPLVRSSTIDIDHSLKAQDKVMAICKAVGATCYLNAIGGTALYESADFAAQGVDLQFLKSHPQEYRQFDPVFVPWLSIVDVMMFNSTEYIRNHMLPRYDLLRNG